MSTRMLAFWLLAPAAAHMPSADEHKLELAAMHRKLAQLECTDSVMWYKGTGETEKDCEWVSKWSPRCSAKGWDATMAHESCPAACNTCPEPSVKECPNEFGTFEPAYGTLLYDALKEVTSGSGSVKEDPSPTVALHQMGSITALIPEAADAGSDESLVADGESGDVDFPFGNLKPLATVGELFDGLAVAGVPDGMGAYLYDDETVRIVVQSESYGFVSGYESYPWFTKGGMDSMEVNGGVASYTGSHVQFADVDRSMLKDFMTHDGSAEAMIKDLGNLIETTVNLKNEFVGPRNRTGATTEGAHFSNTDSMGNYVLSQDAKHADWLMQSLCSASLSEPYMWGDGIGSVDRIYMTNEEWMRYSDEATAVVGLSAHAVDVSTKTAYAVGVFTQGGFEKIVEIDVGHPEYVAWAVSGYNGPFSGALIQEYAVNMRNSMYERSDGNPYVWPENIHPARVYIGKKGYNEMGEAADDFMSRNGLRYGKLYGFACDTSMTGYRDAWHQENLNGATVEGAWVAQNWTWDGVVRDFEHDASWEYQDAPPTTEYGWWTAAGPDVGGAKTEHLSPFFDGTASFVQSSTAGYFGKYTVVDLAAALDATDDDFPAMIDAEYLLYQGETDVNTLIDLGGKGQYAGGYDATVNYDGASLVNGSIVVDSSKTTFEDIDGLEVIAAADGDFVILQEDSGNDLGERTFIAKLQTDTDMDYKFIAMSGGAANTRMAAGVGVPAGANVGGNSHEFSGVVDLSGMLAMDGDAYILSASGYTGYNKTMAAKTVNINDKLILIGLQAHNMIAGSVYLNSADRGGQWLIYQPSI